MATKIDPALQRALGLQTNDPGAFVMAMFRQMTGPLRDLHNRVVARTGITKVKIKDADPKRKGNQPGTLKLRTSGNDGPGELAVKFAALAITKGKSSLYLDEGRRMLLGMPRGLEGEGDDIVPESTLALLGGGHAANITSAPRSLDPVTLTLIIGVGVPLLCALIPHVLPMIMEWGKDAFGFETETAASTGGGAAGETTDDGGGLLDAGGPFDELADTVGIGGTDKDDTMIGVAILAGIVVLVLFLKKKA